MKEKNGADLAQITIQSLDLEFECKLFTVMGGNFKFQVQDSDLEYFFEILEI